MVFTKNSRGNLETRFKKGHVSQLKGKRFKISWESDCKPFKRLCMEQASILKREENLGVRLLRPTADEIPEVEKCNDKSVG